jgi:hypothetical protein
MEKKTPVKWLFEELMGTPKDKFEWHSIYYKAIQMEQEQMVNLIHFMRTQDKMGKSIEDLFEQYWNETYGNTN